MNNTTMTQRWQAAAKQGLCLLLCLLMFVTLLPVKAYAAAKVDRTQALARIAQLQKELEGKYFTTTGNPCNKPGTASHGCTKCTNANVIKASWFKKAVSLIPSKINKCPEGHFYEYAKGKYGGTTASAKSCAGFATFASWYIFAKKSSDNITNKHIATATYNKKLLEKAMPGDLLIFSDKNARKGWKHAAIFIEATSSGAKVLDCNWNTSKKGNCYVSTHTISFSYAKYMSISRASNYDTTAHTHTAGAAWQYDAENHWKLCTGNDNYVMNKAAHSLNTVVEQQGGLYQYKKTHLECATCDYRTETTYSGFQYYKGDLNYDGKVDVIDVAGLYEHLAQGKKLPACQNEELLEHSGLDSWWQEITSGPSGGADLNGDGTTDIYDLQLLYEMASTQKLIVVNY